MSKLSLSVCVVCVCVIQCVSTSVWMWNVSVCLHRKRVSSYQEVSTPTLTQHTTQSIYSNIKTKLTNFIIFSCWLMSQIPHERGSMSGGSCFMCFCVRKTAARSDYCYWIWQIIRDMKPLSVCSCLLLFSYETSCTMSWARLRFNSTFTQEPSDYCPIYPALTWWRLISDLSFVLQFSVVKLTVKLLNIQMINQNILFTEKFAVFSKMGEAAGWIRPFS